MNPIIEKALKHLEKASYAGYFGEMDKITLPEELRPVYAEHKHRFISGSYVFMPGMSVFNQLLSVFTKEVDKNISSLPTKDKNVHTETPHNQNNDNTAGKTTAKHKILFLASSPDDMTKVSTEKEYRTVKSEMSQGSHRDFFEFLQPQFSVTITDLLRAMNDEPTYVHFSGHGANQGIYISKEDGSKQLMPNAALERLFKNLKGITKTVLLNSCYSAEQAKIISTFGIYVIGNDIKVHDAAAISFAKGFYNGLGEGKTVEKAYDDAMIVLLTEIGDTDNKVEVWKDGELLNL